MLFKYYCVPHVLIIKIKSNILFLVTYLNTVCDLFKYSLIFKTVQFSSYRYVCINGSRSARPVDGLQGYICPSGHSCPIGAPLEVPCEPGTYSSVPGAARCLSCPAGTMCPSPGTLEPSPCPIGESRPLLRLL